MENKKLLFYFIIIIFLIIIISLFFVFNQEKIEDFKTEKSGLESNFRNLLENEYPEFTDFENQESFAGKKVKIEIIDGDRYYAYITLGSGLPIVKATCFRIDRNGRTFKIGEFPDPLDSYLGYFDIDPKNCRGIK